MPVMLRSRFPEIEAELGPEVDDAIRDAAHQIAANARLRVPVLTGALRESIHAERRSPDEYAVTAGSRRVFYARFVEFGSARGVAPHPFLTPAAEMQRAPLELAVTKALRNL
jgi:HK97 gp10 family phage protein